MLQICARHSSTIETLKLALLTYFPEESLLTNPGGSAVHINGKLIKPTELKQPDAEALVQVVKEEQGGPRFRV